MKKLWNTAFGYFLAAMAAGVFYRELTKFNALQGEQHWHLHTYI